jgi:putative aminopeptidase FrvX
MKSKEFLKKYLNAYAPVSQEMEGQKIWANYISEYVNEIHDDNYGTVWGIIKSEEKSEKPYKVVIEAHCDEISWIVSHISDDGKISINKLGGSDVQIAPSKKVVIHTRKNGLIPGVFGWPAIHLRKGNVSPELKNLSIDIGWDSKEKVKEVGIEVGNIVTFSDEFEEMGDYYVGKSLDNKIGGFIIAEVARKLKKNNIKLPFDLYIVNSVQEEVGLHGAKMVAQTIKPDIALITDVCHNTNTPDIDKKVEGDIKGGKGAVIEHTAQNHRKLIELMREVADINEISYQLEVGSYGNDTMGFFLSNGGVPTAIIATPLKYMHTTVEMAHKDDVRSVIDLFYHTLQAIKRGQSFKYHNFSSL